MYEAHEGYIDVMALTGHECADKCVSLGIQKVRLRRCFPSCMLSVNNRVTKGAPEVFVPEGGRPRVAEDRRHGFGVTSGGVGDRQVWEGIWRSCGVTGV